MSLPPFSSLLSDGKRDVAPVTAAKRQTRTRRIARPRSRTTRPSPSGSFPIFAARSTDDWREQVLALLLADTDRDLRARAARRNV